MVPRTRKEHIDCAHGYDRFSALDFIYRTGRSANAPNTAFSRGSDREPSEITYSMCGLLSATVIAVVEEKRALNNRCTPVLTRR